MHELRGAFESILSEVIFFLYFILDLMKEWSAFNGQGSGSVLAIWQLLLFLLRRKLPGFTGVMKFQKDLSCCLHLVFSSYFLRFHHALEVDLFKKVAL